jgi:hypothetical protein
MRLPYISYEIITNIFYSITCTSVFVIPPNLCHLLFRGHRIFLHFFDCQNISLPVLKIFICKAHRSHFLFHFRVYFACFHLVFCYSLNLFIKRFTVFSRI